MLEISAAAADLTCSDPSGSIVASPGAALSPVATASIASSLHDANAAAIVGESDALRILFQASAAAESLQQRFSELQQRRSENRC